MANPSESDPNRPVRLAVLGCGAVTELCHVPGASRSSHVELATFVDRDLDRARQVAALAGGGSCVADWQTGLEGVDGVINALPHNLHAPVTIECLERGVPVLVEKPMALGLEEATAMVEAATLSGTLLQVAQMNRFCDGPRIIKRAIAEGWLGSVIEVDVEWGFEYDWPVASGFFFDRAQAGGGVLLDLGSHVIDLLTWWMGTPELNGYLDDDQGGVESECDFQLDFDLDGRHIPGRVVLSRLRNLRNTLRVVGERFTIECFAPAPTAARMWPTDQSEEVSFVFNSRSEPRQILDDAYELQLDAFALAVASGTPSAVSGASLLPTVGLIERCYQERTDLLYPWEPE